MKDIYKKLSGINLSTMPYSVWANMPDSFWAKMPDSVWENMPDSVWANMPDSVWENMPDSFWAKMPDSVWAKMPELKVLKGLEPLNKPYSLLKETLDKSDNSLDMSDWHTCETTHCVAGWIEVLHPQGKEIAKQVNTLFAASVILKCSRPDAPLPNFYGSNEAVMEFINDRAKEEKEGREFEFWTFEA